MLQSRANALLQEPISDLRNGARVSLRKNIARLDRENALGLEHSLEMRRLEWQSRESQLNRQFQDMEAEKNRVFQTEQMAKRSRMEIWVFGVVVTILLVIATILAAFIERGSLFGTGPNQSIDISEPTPLVPETEGSRTLPAFDSSP